MPAATAGPCATTIERARTAVQDTLRVRGQASPRAFQGLIRIEAIDQIFGALIALSDLLEATPGSGSACRRFAACCGCSARRCGCLRKPSVPTTRAGGQGRAARSALQAAVASSVPAMDAMADGGEAPPCWPA